MVEGICTVNRDKLEAQKQWSNHPCGTGKHLEGIEYGSPEFFDVIAYYRYEVTDK